MVGEEKKYMNLVRDLVTWHINLFKKRQMLTLKAYPVYKST
jgi:hypothetical protein